MNKLTKQLITLFGLVASIIAMILINTIVIDPSKYQDANTTSERMAIFVKKTSDSVVSNSKKAFKVATFGKFNKDSNDTNSSSRVIASDSNKTNKIILVNKIVRLSDMKKDIIKLKTDKSIKKDLNATKHGNLDKNKKVFIDINKTKDS